MAESRKKIFEEYYIPEPMSGCWIWIGSTCAGYGRVGMKQLKRIFINIKKMPFIGREVYAHRLSWFLFKGTNPKELDVLHKCDNPLCVNPDHLFLGTQKDNIMDRNKKDRQAKGEKSGLSKLTEEEIRNIKNDKRKQTEIGKDYKVTKQNIFLIKHGVTWKHINV